MSGLAGRAIARGGHFSPLTLERASRCDVRLGWVGFVLGW